MEMRLQKLGAIEEKIEYSCLLYTTSRKKLKLLITMAFKKTKLMIKCNHVYA